MADLTPFFDHQTIRRLLVLRPGAIGDTLLTFPAFAALRQRLPRTQIVVVGNRPVLRLARAAGVCDAVDAFGADWVADLFGDEPTPALRARLASFDLGLVWLHDLAAAQDLARRLTAAGVRQVLPAVSFPPAGSGRHVADHLIDTLAPLGVASARPEVSLALAAEGTRAPLPRDSALVVLHPGAGSARKRWPAERFAALAERLAARGYAVAVTCGPSDEEAVSHVRRHLREARVDILDGLALEDLAAVLARARLVVGNDSGVTHLAALAGAPTLALFGPFDPAYWAPIGPRVVALDAGTACSHRSDPRDGCRRCDLLPTLRLETVWKAIVSLLGLCTE